MKYTITALPAVAALIIAQSALGAAIPACENGCDGNDGNDDPAASSSVAYANPMKTNYHPTVGGAESPCDTCPQELPTGTNEDEDCSDTKLYQIHPVADASLCIAVQIDIDGKVDGSKLVHLIAHTLREPCDRRPLQRNWNLQTIKGDISNGSLHGPTLMRLEDSQWCLDTTSSTPENGWIPHLYNCSEPTAPLGLRTPSGYNKIGISGSITNFKFTILLAETKPAWMLNTAIWMHESYKRGNVTQMARISIKHGPSQRLQ
ncbi:hypothetical protein QFC21_006763 [Naganishia friedmannii]|uniref:Uncharacterized protein n=1 Tax=Naganishia friedmannii TaxID=89922 RepID=A0ACC2V0K0_9TREE|nr:hypothetical protein QFC21_006763 [Naganishia friedmannii]